MSAQAWLNDRYEGKIQCPPKHVLMINMKVKHTRLMDDSVAVMLASHTDVHVVTQSMHNFSMDD